MSNLINLILNNNLITNSHIIQIKKKDKKKVKKSIKGNINLTKKFKTKENFKNKNIEKERKSKINFPPKKQRKSQASAKRNQMKFININIKDRSKSICKINTGREINYLETLERKTDKTKSKKKN